MQNLHDFQLLLVVETPSDLPGFCSPVTGVLKGEPGFSERAPEIIQWYKQRALM